MQRLPGLALSLLVALAALGLHRLLPDAPAAAVGPVLLAVLLGLLVGNLLPQPAALTPGIHCAFGTLLRAAIVLLGASLSLQSIAATGLQALMMVVLLMALALAVAHVVGRLLGVPGKLATLLGVGAAVCGNTAISATGPVIGASDRDLSLAIATNTLFGTLAVFLYPIVGHALGFDDATFGTWAGSAVNDTSQVVATGFAYSEEAGRVATTVKLTRNALMVFVIVGMAFAYRSEATRHLPFWPMVRRSVPTFVLGFLAMALLNTLGGVAWLGERLHRPLAADLQAAAKFLTIVALAGVGLATKFAMLRQTGFRPVLLGLTTALAVSLGSLALIHLLGPA
jgi:uncharacterized integral membrane protein (TIGR00698 family)